MSALQRLENSSQMSKYFKVDKCSFAKSMMSITISSLKLHWIMLSDRSRGRHVRAVQMENDSKQERPVLSDTLSLSSAFREATLFSNAIALSSLKTSPLRHRE